MKTRFMLMFLLFLAACSGNGSVNGDNGELTESSGQIAFVRFAEGDELPSEVVVADEGGDEQESVEAEGVLRLMPTGLSNTVLIIGGEGSTVTHVLDAAAGEAKPVSGAEDLAAQLPGTLVQGERYMALASPAGNQVAVLELEEARLTDLTETMGDVSFVTSAHVSPDDRFVAVSTTEGLWLMPTDNPSEGRTISDANTPAVGGFTEGGSTIVFTERTPDGTEVIAAPLDGGDPETLTSTDDSTVLAFVSPAGDEIALLDSDSVELIPANGGDPTATVDLTGESHGFGLFSASGKRLLVRTGGEEPTYELVDLEAEESQQLDELDGLRAIPLPQLTSSRWLLFSDLPEAGLLGKRVLSLDLDEGDVSAVLSIEESQFTALQSWSPDGRFVLVATIVGSDSTLFLLDMDAGESREVAEGAVTVGAISFDGNQVVFSEGRDSPPDAEMFTVPTGGGEREEIGTGVFPVWVKP